MLTTFLSAETIQADQDAANHAFISASITKVVNAVTKDNEQTFWIMTAMFIGKEIYDCNKPNPTGFSINDLVYDYFGYNLIMFELKF
jgi:hypothetical protein